MRPMAQAPGKPAKVDPRTCQSTKVPAQYLSDRSPCTRLGNTMWGVPKIGPVLLCAVHSDEMKYGDLQ
jgi:hypothetical protein